MSFNYFLQSKRKNEGTLCDGGTMEKEVSDLDEGHCMRMCSSGLNKSGHQSAGREVCRIGRKSNLN